MKTFNNFVSHHLPIDFYIKLLTRKTPFALTRWGDGEFNAVFGIEGENCDGHIYYPAMGYQLEEIILKCFAFKERFYYGLLPIAVRVHGERLGEYFGQHMQPEFVDGRVLLDASRFGKLKPFCQEMSKRKVLYVGPAFIINRWWLKGLFDVSVFVEIPEKNAYLKIDDIIDMIYFYTVRNKVDCVLYSAGMPTEIMIAALHEIHDGQLTQIDCGSMFDPYFDRMSRKYMRQYNWRELRERNQANGKTAETKSKNQGPEKQTVGN